MGFDDSEDEDEDEDNISIDISDYDLSDSGCVLFGGILILYFFIIEFCDKLDWKKF